MRMLRGRGLLTRRCRNAVCSVARSAKRPIRKLPPPSSGDPGEHSAFTIHVDGQRNSLRLMLRFLDHIGQPGRNTAAVEPCFERREDGFQKACARSYGLATFRAAPSPRGSRHTARASLFVTRAPYAGYRAVALRLLHRLAHEASSANELGRVGDQNLTRLSLS